MARQPLMGEFGVRLKQSDSLEQFITREGLTYPVIVQTRGIDKIANMLSRPRQSRFDTVAPGASSSTTISDLQPFQYPVYQLLSKEGSIFPQYVSVGRTKTNDVVVSNPAMPKVGALFLKPNTNNECWKIQIRAKYGAIIDGVQRKKADEFDLLDACNIKFGKEGLAFNFYTPRTFYDFLKSQR